MKISTPLIAIAGFFATIAQGAPQVETEPPALTATKTLSLADATPAPDGVLAVREAVEEKGLVTRQGPGQFRFCRDIFFNNCSNFGASPNVCYNLVGSLNDVLSSAKAGPSMKCYIWENFDCTGARGGYIYNDNLHADLGVWGWNDRASSFACYGV